MKFEEEASSTVYTGRAPAEGHEPDAEPLHAGRGDAGWPEDKRVRGSHSQHGSARARQQAEANDSSAVKADGVGAKT